MTAVSVWIVRIEACLWEWPKGNSLELQDKIKLHQSVRLILLTRILTAKTSNLVANLSVVVLLKDLNLSVTICDNNIQLNIHDRCNHSSLEMAITVLHIQLHSPKQCHNNRFTEMLKLMPKTLLINRKVYLMEVITTWWTLISKTKVNKRNPKYLLLWTSIAKLLIELLQNLSSDI